MIQLSFQSFPSFFSTFHLVDWRGEVPEVREEEKKKILEFIKSSGVEWKNEEYPPVPLDIGNKRTKSGVPEALSLALTGSYLHLPLLKVNFLLLPIPLMVYYHADFPSRVSSCGFDQWNTF